jgi:hypothetical protein
MADEVEAIGVSGGEIDLVCGYGVKIDGATFKAAYEEVHAAGLVPRARTFSAAVLLAGLRTNQKPFVTQFDGPLVEAITQYLLRRGEHGIALNVIVYLN